MNTATVSAIGNHYSRRIAAAVALTGAATVALGALFAGHAASVTESAAGVSGFAGTPFVLVLNLGLLAIVLGGNAAVALRRLTDAAETPGR
jgi:hypothetical protein